MLARYLLLAIAAGVAVYVLVAFILPISSSALFLNLANADLARAVSLPSDAPDRFADLAAGVASLDRARQATSLARLPLAQARLALAGGKARAAADAMDGAAATGALADPVSQYIWGEAEWQANRSTAALTHWRSAGAIEYFMQQAHRASDAHQWKQARDSSRIAVAINPSSADAHYVLGDSLSQLDPNDGEAMAELERAAELTGDLEVLSTILSREGEVLAQRGELTTALARFDQARAFAPIDARPRTDYALTLLKLQPASRAEATRLLEQVVADSPWYTAAFIGLANIAQVQGDSDAAEEWLRKGLASNPDDSQLFFALGGLYAEEHREADARAQWVLALRHETRADDLQRIAKALAELGRQ